MHKDEVADEINTAIDKVETVRAIIEDVKLAKEQLTSALSLLSLHDDSEYTINTLHLANSLFSELNTDTVKTNSIREKLDEMLRLL